MIIIQPHESTQDYSIGAAPQRKLKGTKQDAPRLRIEFERGRWVSVEIGNKVRVLSGRIPKDKRTSKLFSFLEKHVIAFSLHYNRKWTDYTLAMYIIQVGRKGRTIDQALEYLLLDGAIDKIPEEFKKIGGRT